MHNFSKLLILGAGGHGRVVADVASDMGVYSEIAFLDDASPLVKPAFPIIGKIDDAAKYLNDCALFVAIGNNAVRRKLQTRFEEQGAFFATLVSPKACIGGDVSIGAGTVIMPGCIVNNHARLGKGVIVNTSSSVDHDCTIGDYCHIAPGAHLCGTVIVGENSLIGAGATLINNLSICSGCKIGAGTVVIKNVIESGTYIGVPARRYIP